MPRQYGDLLISLSFIAVSAAFLALTFGIDDPNASLFPRMLASTVLAFSVLYFVRALLDRPRHPIQSAEEGVDLLHFLAVMGLALVYIPAMSLAGYLAATAVFTFVGVYMLGYRRLAVLLPMSLALTLLVFVVFKTLMYASLPSSALDNWVTELMYRYVLG
jgi:Tripartite tricarboxylate transporter TctB family